MLLYCNTDDVIPTWIPPEQLPSGWSPETLDPLILQASVLVRYATRGARYEVDDSGYPTDTAVLDTLRDTTCAQVQFWVASGQINPAGGGMGSAGRSVASKSMGGRSVSYATETPEQVTARAKSTTVLCDVASQVLASGGLANWQPGLTSAAVPSQTSFGDV